MADNPTIDDIDAELAALDAADAADQGMRATAGVYTPPAMPKRSKSKQPKLTREEIDAELAALDDADRNDPALNPLVGRGNPQQAPAAVPVQGTGTPEDPLIGQAETIFMPGILSNPVDVAAQALNGQAPSFLDQILGTMRNTGGLPRDAAISLDRAQADLTPLDEKWNAYRDRTRGQTGDNLEPAPELNATQVQSDAIVSGALGAVDALNRLNPGAFITSRFGFDPYGLQKLFDSQERVQKSKAAAPDAFPVYEQLGAAAAPMPGLPAQGIAGTLKALLGNVLLDSITGAGIGTGTAVNDLEKLKGEKTFNNPLTGKVEAVPEINPVNEVLGGLLGGAAGGAGLGGIIHGLGYGAKKIAGGILKKGSRKAPPQAPTPTPDSPPESRDRMAQQIDDLIAQFPDNEELRAARAALGPDPIPEPAPEPIPAPTPAPAPTTLTGGVSEFDAALDAVKNATPDTIDAALEKINEIKEKLTKKLPTKEIRKERKQQISAQINQAHTYYKGLQNNVPAVESKPIQPARIDTQQAPAPTQRTQPLNPPQNERVEPLQGNVSQTEQAPRIPTQTELEAQQFPEAFKPLYSRGRNDGGSSTFGINQSIYANMLRDSEIDDFLTKYERNLQNKRLGDEKRQEYSQFVLSLQQEKMRRAHRKQKGLEPDYPLDEMEPRDITTATDDDLIQAMRSQDPVEVEAAVAEWDRRYPEPEPAPTTLTGGVEETAAGQRNVADLIEPGNKARLDGAETRYRRPDNVGRAKVEGEAHVDVDDIPNHPHLAKVPNLAQAVSDTLQAKLDYDYTKALMIAYSRELINHFAPGKKELTIPGVVKLTYDEVPVLSKNAKSEQAKIKNEIIEQHPGDVTDVQQAPVIKGIMEHGGESLLQKLPDMPLTDDVNTPEAQELFRIAKNIKEAEFDAETNYKGRKRENDPVPGALKKNKETITQANHAHEAANGGDDHLLLNGSAELREVDFNTGQLKPTGRQVRGQIEYTKGKQEKHLKGTADKLYKDATNKLLAVSKVFEKRGNIKVLGSAGGLLASLAGNPAQAADGAVTAASHWLNTVHGDIAGVPYSLLTAAATLYTAAKSGAARVLVEGNNPVSQLLWNDAMDRVHWMDGVFADLAKNLPKNMSQQQLALVPKLLNYKSLEGRIREAQARAHMATFGIKLDPQDAAQINMALSDGTITVKDLLAASGAPGKGTPSARALQLAGNLTADQRRALVVQHAIKNEIFKMATEADGLFKAFAPDGKFFLTSSVQSALNGILEATGPKKASGLVEKAYNAGISNFMEFQFRWNPFHHMTNLTDPWIAGGVAIGPGNIAKAHTMMMDPEIGKLFSNSNLTTSNILDRAAPAAKAKNAGLALPELKDIPTDKWNADRVALASFLQFYNDAKNAKGQFAKEIGNMSQKDFVKALINPKNTTLSPELQLRAWAHMAEKGSRTLGNDLFRVNADLISMSVKSPAIGIFLRQPARLARLVAQDLAQGNVKGALNVIGFTALLGGSAAIPPSAQWAWSKVDPEGLNQAKDFLDQYSLARTGVTFNQKLSWDPAWIMMAAANPIIGGIQESPKAFEDAAKVKESVLTMFENWQKDPKKAQKEMPEFFANLSRVGSRVGSLAAANVLGVPTRFGVKEAKNFAEFLTGKQNVYAAEYFKDKGWFGKKKEIDLEKEGIDRRVVLGEQFLPTYTYKDQIGKSLAEERDTKSHDKWIQQQAEKGGAYGAFFNDLLQQKPNRKTYYTKKDQKSPYDKERYPSDPFAFLGGLSGAKRGGKN